MSKDKLAQLCTTSAFAKQLRKAAITLIMYVHLSTWKSVTPTKYFILLLFGTHFLTCLVKYH
jgi:hypothetical protein